MLTLWAMAALSFERKGQLQGTPMPVCRCVPPAVRTHARVRCAPTLHTPSAFDLAHSRGVPALAIVGPDAAAAAAPVPVLAVFGCLVIVRDGLPGRSAVEAWGSIL